MLDKKDQTLSFQMIANALDIEILSVSYCIICVDSGDPTIIINLTNFLHHCKKGFLLSIGVNDKFLVKFNYFFFVPFYSIN